MNSEKKSRLSKIGTLNTDRVVSISAILVSLGTLFMIFYQTNLVRKEQKASVMPSLQIGYSVNGTVERINLINQGLGPAFIQKVSIIEKDTTYNLDPYSYLNQLDIYDKKETTFYNRIYKGTIISANHRTKIFEKRTDSTSKLILNNLFRFPYTIDGAQNIGLNKAVIEIVYENIYGDEWKIQSNKAIPKKLD